MAADKSTPRNRNFKDFTGNVFGRLTVIGLAHRRHATHWKCQCSCGNVAIVCSTSLNKGYTRSCGCLRRESAIRTNTTHGMSLSNEFIIWQAMKDRCYNTRDQAYPDYGGRGITICDRWKNSFENFYSDMGPRPSTKHSIDRFPNNDGNYEPGNCRWATTLQQSNNTRQNHLLTHNGRTMTMAEWARFTGLRYGLIKLRIWDGWSASDALTTLPNQKRNNK